MPLGEFEGVGGDEVHLDAFVGREGLDQRVDGAAEAEVAAEADGQVVDVAEFTVDGQQVGEGLRRVAVAAVAGVDDGHRGDFRGGQRSALDGVAHGDDVGEAGQDADGVLDGFTLGDRRAGGVGETEDLSAEFLHGGGKAQARTRAGLVEEGGEFLVGHRLIVLLGMFDDAVGQGDDFADFGTGQVGGFDQVFHKSLVCINCLLSSRIRRKDCRGSGGCDPATPARCSGLPRRPRAGR